jgi:cytochrome c553
MRYALIPILVSILTLPIHAQRRPRRLEPSTNPLGMSEAVIEQGRQQYNSSCTACHGLDGDDGDRAPALKGRRRFVRSSDQDLYEAIRNGIKGTLMPASPLKDNEVWTIVAYVRSLIGNAAAQCIAVAPEQTESEDRGAYARRGGSQGTRPEARMPAGAAA